MTFTEGSKSKGSYTVEDFRFHLIISKIRYQDLLVVSTVTPSLGESEKGEQNFEDIVKRLKTSVYTLSFRLNGTEFVTFLSQSRTKS